MKKIKKIKRGKSKLSTWKSIGILLGLVTLFLLLVNSKIILNNFVASPNINKITEVDSSTAKTDLERKAAEELNEAADKADKAKTQKQKEKTTLDLLIKGTVYQAVTKPSTLAPDTKTPKTYDEAIILAESYLKDQKLVDQNGQLTTKAKDELITSPTSVTSTPPQTTLTTPSVVTQTWCNDHPNSGVFGCPYEPGFFYTGDEKCGTSSVAGYYCWGGELYVINLPDTKNAYREKLVDAESKLGNYSGDGSPESKKSYINSLGIYDTATVKKLSEQLIAKNTPPAGGDDGGRVGLSDVEKIAKNTCNKQGYVYDESGKKCTLKLLKPLTMSEKECHTQHPGYVYGADGSCKPNILLTPAQKAVALEACKAGLQDLGGTKTYVTCDSKAVTTRGVQSYNFCTGGGEFIHDYGCAEKGVGEVVNPNGVYTGGESVKPGEESKCIYDAIGGKCNYSTGNTKTKPPLVDRAIAQSPANPAAVITTDYQATYNKALKECEERMRLQNLSTRGCDQVALGVANAQKDSGRNSVQAQNNTTNLSSDNTGKQTKTVGDECSLKNMCRTECKNGVFTEVKVTGATRYYCGDSEQVKKIVEKIDLQNPQIIGDNLSEQFLKNGDECSTLTVFNSKSCIKNCPKGVYTVITHVGAREGKKYCGSEQDNVELLSGNTDLKKFGETCEWNSSCESGICSLKTNSLKGTGWYCMADINKSDLKLPAGTFTDDQSRCEYFGMPTGFVTHSVLRERPIYECQPSARDQQSSLNTTSDPSVPQVAQTGTTALDTGPFVSNPVVTNPAGQPAVNVPGAIDNPPNGLSSKGSGNCIRRGNTYCDGARMYELYSWYRDNDGWWNEDGDLAPAEFTAMMLVAESGGDVELLKAILDASANQLWGRGLEGREPYCTSQADCKAGVLNFTGAYMESAGSRYNSLQTKGTPEDDLKTWNQYLSQLEKEGITLESIASLIVYDQKPRNITANTPTEWGSSGDPDIAKRGNCPVAFEGGGDVVYSFNQKYTWDNTDCE